jgi:hypothetical protein
MPPVIYFGPPKTSSTFLYHAFTAFPNYLRVGTKEWAYLRPLDVLGELDYVDRFGRLHGTRAFRGWRNIYVSYIEHLKHFVQHPSSEYCQSQLDHGHRLIFDRHSVDHYLDLFRVGKERFVVDFCVRNFAISSQLVSQIRSQAPDAVFLVGMRPFVPLLVSSMHEYFVWFAQTKTRSAEVAIDQSRVNDDELLQFGRLVSLALDQVLELYERGGPCPSSERATQAEKMLQMIGMESLDTTGLNDRSEQDYVAVLVNWFYGNTNYVDIIAKLTSSPEQVIFFNAVKVPDHLPELESELRRRGVQTGGYVDQGAAKRIRESSSSVVNRLLADEGVSAKIRMIARVAEGYFRRRVDPLTAAFFFPKAHAEGEALCLETLRKMDTEAKQVIVQPPHLLS